MMVTFENLTQAARHPHFKAEIKMNSTARQFFTHIFKLSVVNGTLNTMKLKVSIYFFWIFSAIYRTIQ
jgi:hypothetical protein